jgi:hypothetical protein
MLQEYAIDEIPLQIRRVGFFQQDGAPPHYARTVRAYLDQEHIYHLSGNIILKECIYMYIYMTLPERSVSAA